MELSDKTLTVLKNYASINPNIVFSEGQNLKTISVARNVMSQTSIEEIMPNNFGIYDLNEFLSVLALVDKPNLSFAEHYVNVGDSTGRSKIKYYYTDKDMLTTPTKDIIMPEADVTFTLDIDTLSKVKRAASVLGHSEISITPASGAVRLSVVDSKDATSNAFSIDVEGTYDSETPFNFIMNVNNLKVVNEDFTVRMSKKLISQFKSQQSEIEYFIALEKTSKYGA
jgi:hypothetical protein